MTPAGLMVCDDLIFTSKVTATARAHGLPMATARTPAVALTAVTSQPATCVLLDLHADGLDLPAFVAAVRPAKIVAFGSHVDAARLKAARAAGVDLVMPRSQFVASLETDLPAWLAGSP